MKTVPFPLITHPPTFVCVAEVMSADPTNAYRGFVTPYLTRGPPPTWREFWGYHKESWADSAGDARSYSKEGRRWRKVWGSTKAWVKPKRGGWRMAGLYGRKVGGGGEWGEAAQSLEKI